MMLSETCQMVQIVVVAWCWLLAVGRGSGTSGHTPLNANSGNATGIVNKMQTTSSHLPVFTTSYNLMTSTQKEPETTTTFPLLPITPGLSYKDIQTKGKQRTDYVVIANPVVGVVDSEEELSTVQIDTTSSTELESTVPADSLDKPDPWDSDVDTSVTSSADSATAVFNTEDLNAQNQSFTTETNMIANSKAAVLGAPKVNISVFVVYGSHSKPGTSSADNATAVFNTEDFNAQNQSFTTETNMIVNSKSAVLGPPNINISVFILHRSHSKNNKHVRKISKNYVRIKHIDIPSRHIITSVPHPFIANYKTTASTLLKRIMADPPMKLKNRSSFKSDSVSHKDRSEHNRSGKSGSDILPSLTSLITVNKDYRKHSSNKRISIGIPASSRVSTRFLGLPKTTPTISPAVSTSRNTLLGPVLTDSDEYYSSYVEYPDLTSANIYNNTGYGEAGVLPDPDLSGEEEVVTEPDPEPVLPDDSLADTDLHDHDLIDSVMYIYFGAAERDEKMAGRQVLVVGAVIALVAQFLTLTSVLRRMRTRPDHSASLILLNSEIALTVGNLIFMLGVQATGDRRHCEFVAIALHYLHLVTCCWFFVNCFYLYMQLKQPEHRTRIRLYCLLAWLSPLVFVLLCLVINRRGYEIRSYCWLSMKRGIMFSFAIPVTALILLNTLFATLGFRVASQCKSVTDEEESHRKSLRIAVTLLPMFSAVWILGVVALESSASLVFPLLFVVGNGFLNWFVFACWLPPDFSMCRESDEDFDEDDDDLYEETPALLKIQAHNQRITTHDSQPLLDDTPVYVCGRRDVCELQMDPICTISS